MKLNDVSFPHPVLGNSDDVRGEYRVETDVKMGRESIEININNSLQNPTLGKLIESDKAVFVAEVNCKQTLYREVFLSKEAAIKIDLTSQLLRNKVEVSFYICAKERINNYTLPEAHPDYSGYSLEVNPGDLLAYGGSITFVALKDWRDLLAVSSFMEIKKSKEKKGPAIVTLTQNKIVLHLCEEDYKKYFALKDDKNLFPIFHASLVLPALMYAIGQLNQYGDDYKESDWYQVLEQRLKLDPDLKKLDWTQPENALPVAQLLIGYPVGRELEAVDKIINSSIGGEE